MKRKLLSTLLALAMALALLPTAAFAAELDGPEAEPVELTDTTTTQITEKQGAFAKEVANNGKVSRGTLYAAVLEYLTDDTLTEDVKSNLKTYYASVTTLDLSGVSIADDGVLAPFTGLTSLDLSNTGISNLGGGIAGCKSSLTTLDLSGNTSITNLNALAGFTKLETLNASNCDLKVVNATGGISGLEGCEALKDLSLSGNSNLDDFGILRTLRTITKLDVSNTGFDDRNIDTIRPNPITTLDLSGTSVTVNGLKALAGAMEQGPGDSEAPTNALKDKLTTLTITGTPAANNVTVDTLTKAGLKSLTTLTPVPTEEPKPDDQPTDFEGLTVTFAEVDSASKLISPTGGKTVTELGSFEVNPDTSDNTKILVTGKSNYVGDFTAFSSNADLTKGNYAALKISLNQDLPAAATVKLGSNAALSQAKFFNDDTTNHKWVYVIMKLDTNKSFELVFTNADTILKYTIDCTGVTLSAAPGEDAGEGNIIISDDKKTATVAAAPQEDGKTEKVTISADGVKNKVTGKDLVVESTAANVTLAKEAVAALSNQSVTVTVTNADAKQVNAEGSATIAADDVKAAVDITVTVDGQEIFSEEAIKDALKGKISITVKGLSAHEGSKFDVFYVPDGSDVTAQKIAESLVVTNGEVTFSVNHLSTFYLTNAGKTSDIEIDDNAPEQPLSVTAAAGGIGTKYTVTTTAGGVYVIQVKQGNSAPAAIFQITATGNTYEFYANQGSTVDIWKLKDAGSAFEGGAPVAGAFTAHWPNA